MSWIGNLVNNVGGRRFTLVGIYTVAVLGLAGVAYFGGDSFTGDHLIQSFTRVGTVIGTFIGADSAVKAIRGEDK